MASIVEPTAAALDWSEWGEPHPVYLSKNPNARTKQEVQGDCPERIREPSAAGEQRQLTLRHLVHECSRHLDFVGITCGDNSTSSVVVEDDDFKVPFIYSLLPWCGFENRTTNKTIEDLGSKYIFRFIGDSTTRRLAESFMSIVTGQGSAHPKVQKRIDFSTRGLKVIFDWAPFCSGPLSTGEMLKTVMAEEGAEQISGQGKDEEEQENEGSKLIKRTVIIAAFGIHDASYQLQVSQNNIRNFYRDQLPQEILKQQGFRAAALQACRDTAAQFSSAAKGVSAVEVGTRVDSIPSEEHTERGRQDEKEEDEKARGMSLEKDHQRGRRHYRELEKSHAQPGQRMSKPKLVLPNEPGGDAVAVAPEERTVRSKGHGVATPESSNADVDVAVAAGSSGEAGPPPPLVFLMQNNGYFDAPEDFQQSFLNQVHRIQREEIGIGVEGAARTSGCGTRKLDAGALSSRRREVTNNSVDTVVVGDHSSNSSHHHGAGVFLLDDSVSLYQKLYCYRIEPSSHYREPVKLMEGKMLWDLIALVDREMNPALPSHDGAYDAAWAATLGALVLGVSIIVVAFTMVARVGSVKICRGVRGGRTM